MEGLGPAGYGDAFADVYDDWYADSEATEAAVRRLAELAGGGRVLELGVGTGRLAIPLATRGVPVTGVDASAAMLERLRAKAGGHLVETVPGDFADVAVDGEFAVIVASYNTLFNLPTADAQRRCLAAAARRLGAGGVVVVEGFVPDPDAPSAAVTPKLLPARGLVLHASVIDHAAQVVRSQHVTIGPAGVHLRPSFVRWATPAQLDAMATGAGLTLLERHAGWAGEPFDGDSPTHVSVYGRHPRRRRPDDTGRATTSSATDATVGGE